VKLTDGQHLALTQLEEISFFSRGDLEVIGDPLQADGESSIDVQLSLATRSYRVGGGLSFRDRERLTISISADFPFSPPSLYFRKPDYLGAPHVQWGRSICLYQSVESEWRPFDGLYGFFERVHEWFTAAGAGTLDPDDAPLHPPVAYTASRHKFVMKVDAPEPGNIFWIGRAEFARVRADRSDLLGWTALSDWDDVEPKGNEIVAAVLLAQPFPLEYPSKLDDLWRALRDVGVPLAFLVKLLRLVALMAADGTPAHVVLGAPMRRKAGGEPLRQHLTVWEIEAEALIALRALAHAGGEDQAALDAVVNWMTTASVKWCPVFEDRPEIVERRDTKSLAQGVRGRRILLFGCGALGSAVAEQLVRAGAAAIELVDKDYVKPGVLVRQRFADRDIVAAKAAALRDRLDALGLPCMLTSTIANLRDSALSRYDLSQWDLVIDATASARVGSCIERELANLSVAPPILCLSVSAAAQHGAVMTRMSRFAGGPVRLARQAKLAAFAGDADHPAIRAFWPEAGSQKPFQPEPGCSEPTFVGSAIDIDFHAAGLLNLGLARLSSLGPAKASFDVLSAPWVDMLRPNLLRYEFSSPRRLVEKRYRYSVLQSPIAKKGIDAEIARLARNRSPEIETGGLMFGEIDDAHRHIWIDSVSGPPADSEASADKFLCGTAGTVELAECKKRLTGGSSRFVGIWHTHPVSRGQPSNDDLNAMLELLHLQPFPPRQVVMLIIGFAASRPQFNYYMYHRGDFRLIEAGDMTIVGMPHV